MAIFSRGRASDPGAESPSLHSAPKAHIHGAGPAAYIYNIKGDFEMLQGSLREPAIAYETWGVLDPGRTNAVLLFTGLSPSAHAASSAKDPHPGWWEDMIGPDKPIDTRRYFVICVNSLGSCFGSTGPTSTNPETGQPYRLSFPLLTLEDIANAGAEVVGALGIERLYATAGASMGGMTALAFCLLHPKLSAGLICISSATHSLPFSIALRSLQREMICTDPAWKNGNYPLDKEPFTGMRLARKLGMVTYRSAAEWESRFGRERSEDPNVDDCLFRVGFEVESYLDAHANKFIGSFDANCYLYLSRSVDLFDVANHGGTVEAGLRKVQVQRAMVIGVESDFLFPLHQQAELAEGLRISVPEVDFRALPSIQGHDSFLIDMDRFRPAIADFFSERPRG